MCPPWAAPPAADTCLDCPDFARRKKGGTIIQPQVMSLDEHERWLSSGGYKPIECPRADCRCRLHSHGTRTRRLKGALGTLEQMVPALLILIAVYRCPGCCAVWRVLPGFVPRWLHSTWSVVREAVEQTASARVPARTRRRWSWRLQQLSRVPVQVLSTSGDPQLRSVSQEVGLAASRGRLVSAWKACRLCLGCALGSLAEQLHRLTPGIRLI